MYAMDSQIVLMGVTKEIFARVQCAVKPITVNTGADQLPPDHCAIAPLAKSLMGLNVVASGKSYNYFFKSSCD